ncbi:MAG: TonB-dependent receptor plug domain-containing protein, partial [Candidatus Binatia bacterium]
MPISITTIGKEILEAADIDRFHEIAELAPNVHVTSDACCSTVYVRGFGSPFSPSAFEPSVGFAIDELSIPRGEYLSDALYDLERVEVLRGPQGMLFGKNTTAGLFHVLTAAPTKEFTGHVLGRVGNLGAHRAEIALGGPVYPFGDIAQFRLALLDFEGVGDVENTFLDEDEPSPVQRAGRLKLALQPLDGLEITLAGERVTTESRPFHAQQTNLRQSSLDFLRQFDPEIEDDWRNHQSSISQMGEVDRQTDRVQANLRYRWDGFSWLREPEVVAVIAHTESDADLPFDVDQSPADILSIDSPSEYLYDQQSAELRFAGTLPAPFGLGDVEVLLGGLVFESDFSSDSPFRAG